MKNAVLVALAIFAFASFAQSAEKGVTDKAIRIGQIIPMNGPSVAFGNELTRGTRAYLERVNKAGGVHGRKIELVTGDDGYEPINTIPVAKKLMEGVGIFSFLTNFGTPTISALLPTIEQYDIPILGPIATSNLTEPVKKNVFTVRPNAYQEMKVLLNHIVTNLKISEIAVFYQDDSFGTSGLAAVNKVLNEKGMKVVEAVSYKRNNDEVDEALNKLIKKNPGAVIVHASFPATATFMKRAIERNFTPTFAGVTAVSILPFMEQTKDLDMEFFVDVFAPIASNLDHPLAKALSEDLKAIGINQTSQFAMEAYMNAIVMVEGLKRAGKNPTRDSFRSALESIQNFDLGGGVKVSYSAQDHQGLKEIKLAKLKGGKLHMLDAPRGMASN